MRIRSVVFDLDGTLLNSLQDLADCVNQLLVERSFPAHPMDSYRYFVGQGAQNLVRVALPEHARTPGNVTAALERFYELYAERWQLNTVPYDGVSELLDALTERGLDLAIFSNKPDKFTKLCVSALLPRWRFRVVLGAGPNVPRKPDPFGLRLVLKELNTLPDNALYLGDTQTDMQTARAVGVFAIGALWGFRTRDELEAHGAQALINSPLSLLDYV